MYNGGISKIKINSSMVPNFVMKVDHILKLRPHRLNFERVTAVQSLKIHHYTKVCDLVKIGV